VTPNNGDFVDDGEAVASDAAMDVGADLRRRRARAEMTQAALAKTSGVGQKTISAIETGRRPNPTPIVIGKLDLALGAGGELLAKLEASRGDQAGWRAVQAQLDRIAERLVELATAASTLIERFDREALPNGDRQWLATMAGYAASLTEAERATLVTIARQLADKHSHRT
jgi:transcriptional regulator with XRE-family HTH domain